MNAMRRTTQAARPKIASASAALHRRAGALVMATVLACVLPLSSADAGEARFAWFGYDGRDVTTQARAAPGQFLNPVVSGYAPDPSVTRVGDDFYLVNSSFTHFPGLPILHSRDLVNWTQIGNALTRPEQIDFSGMPVSGGIMAPDISYGAGRYYIVSTSRSNFVMTARNPAGPWSKPVLLPFEGIDPSIFWDDDGKAYIVNNGPPPAGRSLYPGHHALWIQAFDPVGLKMVGPRTPLVGAGPNPPRIFWPEGPHIFKKDGYYYLIAAAGGTRPGERHSQLAFRSRALLGPYEAFSGNPILDQNDLAPDRPDPVESVGHAKFVTTRRGEWWAVFLGARPYAPELYNVGRETFLMPVQWRDGWPIIHSRGSPMPLATPRPDLPAEPRSKRPPHGDLAFTDTFDGKALPLGWFGVRVPKRPIYRLEAGDLVLTSGHGRFGDLSQALAFIGRKQGHAIASATTLLTFSPERAGERAGLVAMQSDDSYLFVGIERTDAGPRLALSARRGAADPAAGVLLATAPLPAKTGRGSPIRLKLSIDRGAARAWYATTGEDWIALGDDLDATFLSTKKAGGFVGTVLGLYRQ